MEWEGLFGSFALAFKVVRVKAVDSTWLSCFITGCSDRLSKALSHFAWPVPLQSYFCMVISGHLAAWKSGSLKWPHQVTILKTHKTSLTNGNSSSTRCGSTDTPKQQTSETFVHCMNYHEFTQAQETMAQVGTRHAFWQYTPSQICRSKAADKAFFSRNLCRSRQKSWQSCRLLWRRLWNLLIYQRSSWDIFRHIKTVGVTSKLWIDTDSITAMRKSAR